MGLFNTYREELADSNHSKMLPVTIRGVQRSGKFIRLLQGISSFLTISNKLFYRNALSKSIFGFCDVELTDEEIKREASSAANADFSKRNMTFKSFEWRRIYLLRERISSRYSSLLR